MTLCNAYRVARRLRGCWAGGVLEGSRGEEHFVFIPRGPPSPADRAALEAAGRGWPEGLTAELGETLAVPGWGVLADLIKTQPGEISKPQQL